MSWLFSKAMMEAYGNLPCSQEQAAEYSADACSDGEQFAQLNVMPTPHKFWRNDKTMEFCDLSRFGLTLRLLTEDHGAALLMSYLADFRARTSVLPEQEKVLRGGQEVDYGHTWQGSFAKYDHDSSLWKTAQCSLLEDSGEFLETWPRWGSMRNGESFLRKIPALFTHEKESGLLPTPTATDYKGAPSIQKVKERMAESSRGVRLPEQLARDGYIGPMNPDWVEWLMGLPIGWTALKPLEMHKFQGWLQQHG